MKIDRLHRIGYLPLLACLAACGSDSERSARPLVRDSAGIHIVENSTPRWPEGSGWRLSEEPTLDIGVLEGDPAYQLYRVADAVKMSDGRIAVANSGTHEIRFYDAPGRFLASAGREGGGPGEFEGLSRLWTHADSLLAYDYRHDRVSIFDTNGVFVRSFNLQFLMGAGLFPYAEAPFADGSFLISARRMSRGDRLQGGLTRDSVLYLRCDPEGVVLDSLGWFPGAEWYVQVDEQSISSSTRIFGRSSDAAAHGDGFYFGSSDSYEIDRYDAAGVLTRVIRKAHANLAVTAQDIDRFIQQELADADDENERIFVRRMFGAMPVPETMPAYQRILTDDDGNLWVEEYRRPGDQQPRWTVFNRDGELLGEVETPPRFRIYQIGTDFVLGRWLDDLDVQHVRLYELRKRPGAT
jgi:hypothetical protein